MTMRTFRHLSICSAQSPCSPPRALVHAQQLDTQALGDDLGLFQVRPHFHVLTGAGAHVERSAIDDLLEGYSRPREAALGGGAAPERCSMRQAA